jgi:hypothetical protein
MGKVSMGPMLQTLGLALIVVRDDEQSPHKTGASEGSTSER